MEPWELNVSDLLDQLGTGGLSPREVLDSCLSRIDDVESFVHAWAYLDPELARRNAAEAAAGPLGGVPAGIKDIFNTADMPAGMGSPVWESFTPGNDARVVYNARRAGSVIMGKTVTAEFAVHTPGKTINPHGTHRSPGTSSSGSAAAVASGMVPWALGSQTAGSIVRPASYCGIYGYKPSYGVIPRTGMLKTTDTLDQIGFFTRSPRDLFPLLSALRVRGRDYPLLARTLDRSEGRAFVGPSPRIGVITDSIWTWEVARPDVQNRLAAFVDRLANAGCSVESAECPQAFREAHSVHATIYDRCIAYYFAREAREGRLVSDQIMEMVERGRQIPLSSYTQALDRQTELQRRFEEFSAGFEALLTLSTSGPAPEFGGRDLDDSALIWSLCGAPALSAPVLASDDGMPVGAQFISGRRKDHELLAMISWLADQGELPEVGPVDPARLYLVDPDSQRDAESTRRIADSPAGGS